MCLRKRSTISFSWLIPNQSPAQVNRLNHALTWSSEYCLHHSSVTGAERHSFSQLREEKNAQWRGGELVQGWVLVSLCGCGDLNLTPDSDPWLWLVEPTYPVCGYVFQSAEHEWRRLGLGSWRRCNQLKIFFFLSFSCKVHFPVPALRDGVQCR